jgi:hypothetical protein
LAASAWKVTGKAKRHLGRGAFTLHTGNFYMALHTTAASALLSQSRSVGGIDTWASVGNQISVRGGYTTAGEVIPVTKWSTGANNSTLKFYYTATGLVYTASNSSLINIRYAVIRNSTGAGAGNVLCYAALSTAQFTITSPNTLTVLPAATGVFTLN